MKRKIIDILDGWSSKMSLTAKRIKEKRANENLYKAAYRVVSKAIEDGLDKEELENLLFSSSHKYFMKGAADAVKKAKEEADKNQIPFNWK
tara:strand:+ start:556 stop:828 length:273 start_codon:yes stop_codon:yes gene_type:complete